MGTPEGKIKNDIFQALVGRTYWNNPTGRAVAIHEAKKPCRVCGTRPVINKFISFGLPGSADILGITPVTITPDMVGKRIGVFTGIEVKTDDNDQQENQRNFQAAVEANNGFYIVARGTCDLKQILGGDS